MRSSRGVRGKDTERCRPRSKSLGSKPDIRRLFLLFRTPCLSFSSSPPREYLQRDGPRNGLNDCVFSVQCQEERYSRHECREQQQTTSPPISRGIPATCPAAPLDLQQRIYFSRARRVLEVIRPYLCGASSLTVRSKVHILEVGKCRTFLIDTSIRPTRSQRRLQQHNREI